MGGGEKTQEGLRWGCQSEEEAGEADRHLTTRDSCRWRGGGGVGRFIIFFIMENCLISLLTSSSLQPLPLAMRFRRDILESLQGK